MKYQICKFGTKGANLEIIEAGAIAADSVTETTAHVKQILIGWANSNKVPMGTKFKVQILEDNGVDVHDAYTMSASINKKEKSKISAAEKRAALKAAIPQQNPAPKKVG